MNLTRTLLILGTTIIAFIVAETLIFPITMTFKGDAYWYIALAKNLLAGQGLLVYGHPLPFYTFGFPTAIALFYMFVKDFTIAAKLVSLFAGVGSICLAFFLWKRLINWKAGILVGIFLITNSMFLVYSNIALIEILFGFLLLACFSSLFVKGDKKYILLGISLSALVLTRYEGYIVTLIIFITLIWWEKLYKLERIKELLKNKYLLAGLSIFITAVIFQFSYNIYYLGYPIPLRDYAAANMYVAAGESIKGSLYEMFVSTPNLLLLILAIAGICLIVFDKNKVKDIVPILSFLAIFIVLHLLFLYYDDRYFVPLLPFIYGFSAYFLLFFVRHIYKIFHKEHFAKLISTILITATILFSAGHGYLTLNFHIYDRTTEGLVAKLESEQLMTALPVDAKIYVRDVPAYQLYLNKTLYDWSDFEAWAGYEWTNFTRNVSAPDPPDVVQQKLLQFWVESDIHYVQVFTGTFGPTNIRGVQLFPKSMFEWYTQLNGSDRVTLRYGTVKYIHHDDAKLIYLLPISLNVELIGVAAMYYDLQY